MKAVDDDYIFELTPNQIRELISLANFKHRDVFYDLGAGRGKVIIQVAKETPVKRAVGIEFDIKYYEPATLAAITKLNKKQLRRVDFWFGDISAPAVEDGLPYFYDIRSNATIVYCSLDENEDFPVSYLKEHFHRKPVKIITKNLPLVGYESIANREDPDCWFFLMQWPLKKITSHKKWASSVMGTPAAIEQVYDYYKAQIRKQYPDDEKYAKGNLLELMKLVNDRF